MRLGHEQPGTSDQAVSPQRQAELIATGIARARRLPWVETVLVYSLRDTGTDPAVTGLSRTTYSLFFGATATSSTSTTGSPQAARPGAGITRPLPRTPANLDSWAFVVD